VVSEGAVIDFQDIFEYAPDPLIVIAVESGGAFRFVKANLAVERLSGISRDKLLGAVLEDICPPDQAVILADHYRRCLALGELVEFQQVVDTPAGRLAWQVRARPYCSAGETSHVILVARDVTIIRDIAQQLNGLDGQLPGVLYQLSYSPQEGWRCRFLSANSVSLLGLTPDQAVADVGALLGRIHPDDYDRVIEESMECAATLKSWYSEFRIRCQDDRILWVAAHDIPQKLGDGTVLFTGYLNDVTERKLLEESLRLSELRYRQLVENASDIIATVDAEGRLSYVSPNWQAYLGHEPGEVMNSNISEYIHPEDLPRYRQFLLRFFQVPGTNDGVEYRVRHKDGRWFWYSAKVSPLFDGSGTLENLMFIARDTSKQKALEQEIRRLAEHDAVTGLVNRVAFMARLGQALEEAARTGVGFALLYLDLDRFKQVNDSHGHGVGDRLLRLVGERICHAIRSTDLVGRIGGDEFMILLNGSVTAQLAHSIGQKVCDALASPFYIDDVCLVIGASVGVALYPLNGVEQDALSRAADVAMYRAKALGGGKALLA